MPHVIAADDLTGAADAGAPFAQAGLRTYLALRRPAVSAVDVLVLSTESRHLSPGDAYARTFAAVSTLPRAGLVYKKIDSTLRGNPAAELKAVMDAMVATQALIAPAFPAQERTTIGGRQLVGGVPIEQTAFARDVVSSDIAALLRHDAALPVSLLPLSVVRLQPALAATLRRPGLLIADAETDEDLAVLAAAALDARIPVLCGSAGLARALTGALPAPPAWQAPLREPRPGGPVLVVAGSRHPRTRRQVYAAADTGAALVAPTVHVIDDPLAFAHVAATAEAALAAGRHTLLSTVDMPDVPAGGPAVAAALAHVAAELIARTAVGALVLTGGDVAVAVLQALQAQGVWLHGEVDSGIPWGRLHGGAAPGLPVVTKAGGFGAEDTLAEAIEYLSLQLSVPAGV